MILLNRSLIYPFPAVQYIPINMNIQERFTPTVTEQQIYVGSNQDGFFMGKVRRELGIELNPSQFAHDEGIMVVSGLEFQESLYRAYYLTILGNLQPGGFVANFPLKYFYKTPIVIQVRSVNGDLLASDNFKVPENTSKYLK